MLKRLFIITLLFIAICFGQAGELCAAPSNGSRLPPKGSREMGYEYNVMFRRALDRSYGNLASQNHFYTISFGIFDWLCLDGKIGFGDVRQKGGIHLPKIEYNTGFGGGYGFRIKAFDNERWGVRIILGAQHTSVHPRDRSVDDDKYESFLDDWQICGLVSKSFNFLTAYLGMKVSDCEIVYKINKHDKKRRYSGQHIGLVSGLDLFLFKDRVRINVEARFFDETAFSTSIGYLF